MISKQSNNIIGVLHRLITSEYGENYWFNGCARYVMECLGEKDYDYQFFAGLTGDVFAQHYRQPFMGDGIDMYYQVDGKGGFYEDIFAKCGYCATHVKFSDICKNKEMYLQTLMAYIDRGVPVITLASGVKSTEGGFLTGVFVGYEDYGKTLLYITGNDEERLRISFEDALTSDRQDINGWIFVGDKSKDIPLADIYRDAVYALPALLKTDDGNFCFGSAAFGKWADDVESGYFDGMKSEEFDEWPMYTNFVCVLATNGSCCYDFLSRAKALNPDMTFLDEVAALYRRTGEIWNNDGGNDLEALGGGFNITLETLQSPEKRVKIAARIRECGDIVDEIVKVLIDGLEK